MNLHRVSKSFSDMLGGRLGLLQFKRLNITVPGSGARLANDASTASYIKYIGRVKSPPTFSSKKYPLGEYTILRSSFFVLLDGGWASLAEDLRLPKVF